MQFMQYAVLRQKKEFRMNWMNIAISINLINWIESDISFKSKMMKFLLI